MWLKTALLIIMAFALLLQGCGRKGPLKLPVQAAPVASHVNQAPHVPAAASAVPATQPVQ